MRPIVNHPGFHRRRSDLALCRSTAARLAEHLVQSRQASLGLIKIATVVASNPQAPNNPPEGWAVRSKSGSRPLIQANWLRRILRLIGVGL
jgi:hypothetical protein